MLGDPAVLAERFVAIPLHTTRKQAEVGSFDSFTKPISNSEQRKAELCSDETKAAMDCADMSRLANYLPFIQANNFP